MIQPPKKSAVHNAKMSSDTTFRKDFVTYPVTPPAKRIPVEFQPPEVGMQMQTEYNDRYLGKWEPPTPPILHRQTVKDYEPFDHSTTHGTDFVAPPVTPRQVYRAQHNYEPPKNPFDGVSTSRTAFINYGNVPKTPSFKRPSPCKERSKPMEGNSSYQSTYTIPELPKKKERKKEKYVPPKEKISDMTTFRSSFPKHPGFKPPESKKHVDKRCDLTVPFESKTTNQMHYKTWELPKKELRPPTAYVPPTAKVSDSTTNRSDFRNYGNVLPAQSFKPVQKPNTNTTPLEGLTTQNVDYRAWKDVKKPDIVRQEKEYEPPKEKFDPSTTFNTYFKGISASPSPSAKPPEQPLLNQSKMNFLTSYNNSFSHSGYKPCPSVPLLTNDSKASKYTFAYENPHGHKFYKLNDTELVRA